MINDEIFTKQRLINLGIIITAIWFTWFAQNTLDEYTVRIINNVAIFIILAVSYNLINGVTGQFSPEPNGFVAIGAYVVAILTVDAEETRPCCRWPPVVLFVGVHAAGEVGLSHVPGPG